MSDFLTIMAGTALLWLAFFVFGIATGHTPREASAASSGALVFLALSLGALVLMAAGTGRLA